MFDLGAHVWVEDVFVVYLRRRRRRQQLPLIWPWHNKKLTASWSPFRTPSEWYSSLVHAFCQVVVYYFSDITTLVFSIYHQRTFTSPRTPNMTPLQRFMRYSFSSKYILFYLFIYILLLMIIIYNLCICVYITNKADVWINICPYIIIIIIT